MRGKTLLIIAALLQSAAAISSFAAEPSTKRPLVIQDQGSFAVGGQVSTEPGVFDGYKPALPAGQTYHGDHASVFYQIPVHPRQLPIVMLHGAGQSSRSWETTPDGREGFQTLLLRSGFSTYVVDQPRRGQAGRSTVKDSVEPVPDEQMMFNQFRLGVWPSYFPGVQFSHDPEALNQYFRSMAPNTGPFDAAVISDSMAALFNKIGPGILVTHSQGGGPGWLTAIKSQNVRAIVAFEPGSGMVFPEGEVPAPMPSSAGTLEGISVPLLDFIKLTRIPIIVYYGDNIPAKPSDLPGLDNWRVRLAMARLWRDAVNRHGGDVTLVHLPDVGVKGNTHFAFSDTNNVEIERLMMKFLSDRKLDRRTRPISRDIRR